MLLHRWCSGRSFSEGDTCEGSEGTGHADTGDGLGERNSNLCVLNDNSIKVRVLKPEFCELRIILSSASM